MQKQYKRRFFPIVNRSLQYRFLATIFVYCFVIVTGCGFALFGPDILKLQGGNLSIEAQRCLADRLISHHPLLWPFVMALAGCIGLHSFYFFHRIIGPLFRFQTVFEQVGNGDLSIRVGIRKRDYLHDEERAINEMIGGLADKLSHIQGAGGQALASLGELERMIGRLGEGPEAKYKYFLDSHRRHLMAAMHGVNQFTLPKEETPEKEAPPFEQEI